MWQITRRLIVILASGAGVGFLPYFPGTFGTLAAVPVSLAVNRVAESEPVMALIALAGLILTAVVLAGRASRILEKKDPQTVVVDEIAGFAVANFLTHGVSELVIAFVLFRIFDIAKVFPASHLERLPGGGGIVFDDIMAGLYTFLVLRLLASAGLV